jgi:hypothetical protein
MFEANITLWRKDVAFEFSEANITLWRKDVA